MISITISADQIRSAPTDVRKWIEGEVAGALGLQAPTPATQRQGERLAVCSAEEVGAILSLIQGALPVVNVFFELGHQGVSFGQGELEAYRLSDLLHRARLHSVEQVVACLDVINEALQRIRGTAKVSLYGLDNQSHCFIAAQTQQNIRNLWKHVVESNQMLTEGSPRPAVANDIQQAADANGPVSMAEETNTN
jgi:hypothetical protein